MANNSCPSPPHIHPSDNQIEAMSDWPTSEGEQQHLLSSPSPPRPFDPHVPNDEWFNSSTPSSSSSSSSSAPPSAPSPSPSITSISSSPNQSQQKKEKKKRKKVMMKPRFVQKIVDSPRVANKINQGRVREAEFCSWLNELSPPRLYCVAFALGEFGNFKRPALKGSRNREVISDNQQCFGTIDSSEKSRGLRTLSFCTQILSSELDIEPVLPELLESITDRYGTTTKRGNSEKYHDQHEGLPLLINQFHLPAILIETRIVLKGEQPRVFETDKYLYRVLSQHPKFNTKRTSWDLASLLKFWCEISTPKTPAKNGKKRQHESNQDAIGVPSLVNLSDLCAVMIADGMEVPSDLTNLTPLEFTLQWLRVNWQADQEIIAALNEWLDSGDTEFPLFPPDKVWLLQTTTQNTTVAALSSSSSSSSIPTTPASEEGESQPPVEYQHPVQQQCTSESFATFEPATLAVSQSFAPSKLDWIAYEHASDMMTDITPQDELHRCASPRSSIFSRSASSHLLNSNLNSSVNLPQTIDGNKFADGVWDPTY